MLVVPREGAATALHVLLSHSLVPEALLLKLFTNNRWPTLADTVESFREAEFFGYAPIRLEPTRWTISAYAPAMSPETVAEHEPQTFGSSSRQMATHFLYGYYLVGAASARCYWAERFTDGPYPIARAGERITVTPRLASSPTGPRERSVS